MPTPDNSFLPQRGTRYRMAFSYQKSECIYDVTVYFVHKFLSKSDRTVDQMIQAARSGKQNIAEGMCAGATSRETEIKLLNVAKASLQELRLDYEDYLRSRGFEIWQQGDERLEKARKIFAKHNDSAFYRGLLDARKDATIANLALILIAQTDYLLFRQIERAKKQFLELGGIREEMTRARLAARGSGNGSGNGNGNGSGSGNQKK